MKDNKKKAERENKKRFYPKILCMIDRILKKKKRKKSNQSHHGPNSSSELSIRPLNLTKHFFILLSFEVPKS